MRVYYRMRQFWQAMTALPNEDDLALARQALTPALMAHFQRLQACEQAHGLWIFRQLYDQGESDQDLLDAALLHDVGKSCHPLHLWERVVIVLGKTCFPKQSKVWGQGQPRGWRRPFVIAKQHAAWGAEIVRKAGASPQVVALVRRHQEPSEAKDLESGAISLEDHQLHRLQLLDEEN